jgi:hypothetical protein
MYRVVAFGVLATFVSLPFANSALAAHWVANSTGDWTGHDRTWSVGVVPLPEECNEDTRNTVAVCWPNHHNPFRQGQLDDFCTYKTVTPVTPANGGDPGQVYVCR